MEVHRYLKGVSALRTLPIEFRSESYLDISPDSEDRIWFIRRKLESGRYLVTDWRWGSDSLPMILSAIQRVDRKTRIPGMPQPVGSTEPITVSLAADDGQGRAVGVKKVASLREIALLVQFENHSSMPESVMPFLDGSDVHWRFPYYDLEILSADGKPMPRAPTFRCKNINPFRARDVVMLQPGEVFRTSAPIPWTESVPGIYKTRLQYTAKRDLTTHGL